MEPSAHHVATPDSIAHLDSVSDGEPCDQQSHSPIPQQQPFASLASFQMAQPETAKQARVASVDGGPQEHTHLDTCNSPQTVQAAQITDERQSDDTIQLFSSHTVNFQTSGPLPEHLHAYNTIQMRSGSPVATGEIEVKPEPTIDYRDLFETFTNEDSYDKNSQENTKTERASNDVSGLVDQEPIAASIKSEPDIGDSVNTNLPKCVDFAARADYNTPPAHIAASRPEHPSRNDKQYSGADLSETEAFPKRVHAMTPESHDVASGVCFPTSRSSLTPPDGNYITQLSREQEVQNLIQQSIDSEASPILESHQNYANPVGESQRYVSVNTVPIHAGMDFNAANLGLSTQQWQQWQQLAKLDPRFAKQAYDMIHGPLQMSPQSGHVEDQQITGSSAFTGPTNLQSGNPNQHFSTSQPRVNNRYNSHLPHQSFSSHPPYPQPFSQRIPSAHGASLQMFTSNRPGGDSFTSAGPIVPHNAQVDEGDKEMSEQSHLSMIDQSPGGLAIPADSVIGPPEEPEDPSDNDASDVEPISWKLPSFEITYHGPEKPNDNHEAAVSIPNLVREHVALTDDHHQQEMQLFLEVFLPAQRALQTPDPEPAHAVINFHTISVMVLEAFVQWEIGDELGRGYGFHGGNTAMRPEPQGKEDDEPERIRSATDADVDEIFFAVLDRWRAGMLSDKGTLKLIRGCQEFCDIALDVIHFIKEHGLLSPEEKKRKERSDKGSVRGSKGDAEDSKGKRKADAGKVNNLASRKKSKTEDKKGKKPVAKAKKRDNKSTVVVVRKK